MEELCKLTKTIPGLQAAISMVMKNKNLLFITLGSQITIDFVWKTQARFHSFTLNFVNLLYCIICDARTNLIIFYWNLYHLVHLTWFSEQFFVHHTTKGPQGGFWGHIMEELFRLKENILGTQAAVSLMVLGKNLLFSTLGSQITKDFVWKSKAAIQSFTLNFVKLLYLIFWDARTN